MRLANVAVALMAGAPVLLSSCASKVNNQTPTAGGPGSYAGVATVQPSNVWPLRFNVAGTDFTVFEPQPDSWDGHQLVARSAVAVQGSHQPEATYGVVSFTAVTLVDKNTHRVTLANFQVTSADFPTAPNQKQKQIYLAMVSQNLAQHAPVIPLDHLQAGLTVARPKADHLINTPPKIIITTSPAVLVYVDGAPAWRPVPGTSLQQVINTRLLLLKDPAGVCYLHLFDGYLRAPALDGPWTVASQPPAGAATAEKQARDSGFVDLMPGTPDLATQRTPSLTTAPLPEIFVATTPSELIQFRGAPQYAAIPDTDLLYAINTSGNVFKSLTDRQNYLLISGRWYRAQTLNGPWKFVPGDRLPHDFANIPDSSPKENVKACVPGTLQAEEALIANSIPESTEVARTNHLATPPLDGTMQLAPIEGTPLQYIINSPVPIIEVTPQSWYACENGVWYFSTSAAGPWTVATSIPPAIYTIPPSSPLHYLTYVQVYGAGPGVVYEGYTPGYLGTEVADDGTVVYGTGYDYDSWIGGAWYGPPITWGWGFNTCWTPWWGWGYGCGFGWSGCFPPRPCWSGFGQWHNYDGNGGWRGGDPGVWANAGADIYHDSSPFAAGGTFGRGGNINGFGQAYNSRTGWLQAGQQARVQSVSGAAWIGIPRNYAYNQVSAGSFYNGRLDPSIAPRFGDQNRGFETYSRGSWQGGNAWHDPAGRAWPEIPGNSFQRGAAPAAIERGAAEGGAEARARAGGGFHGGFHGGGGSGFHGGGGGGGGGHR